MVFHYFKFAFRNIRKYKTQSLVGIFGLALAFTIFVFGSYWLKYENSYDMFYPDAERIRLMISHDKIGQEWATDVVMPLPMADELLASFPEIETAARCITFFGNDIYKLGENYLSVEPYYVDTEYINMLTFNYVEGNKKDVLEKWNTANSDNQNIILTESIARIFFGNEPAVGKNLYGINTGTQNTVLAVISDVPQNSNFQYNVLTPIPFDMISWKDNWDFFAVITYIKLKPHINEQALSAKLKYHMIDRGWREHTQLDLAPLNEIHKRFNEDYQNVKFKTYPLRFGYIIIFAVAGLLILLCAYINFMTLAFSRFMEKHKELVVRRVFGARHVHLNCQLLTSLGIEALFAMLISVLLVWALMPLFSSFVFLNFRFGEVAGWLLVCIVVGLLFTLLTGLLPGHYINALRVRMRGRNTLWRKIMITVQLFIGVLFIFCVMAVSRQFSFMQHFDIGFDRSNIVEITKPEGVDWTLFKTELEANPNILETSIVHYPFFGEMGTNLKWEGQAPNDSMLNFQTNNVDVNFIDFFGIKLKAGDFFDTANPDPTKIVINQTAANVLGFAEPVGQFVEIQWGGGSVQIIGVVNDFHISPLRKQVEPMILRYARSFRGKTYIKVHPDGIHSALEYIRSTYEKHASSNELFSFQFLDDEYARFNSSEQAMRSIFSVMAILCLLISIFGIYSMVTLSIQHRRREIAIRKVYGAEVSDIVIMFFREYLMLALIANVAALPVAYLLMNRWLQDYAYRVSITWWMFAAVLALIFVVVLTTLSLQVLKAANKNPAYIE